MEFDPALGEIDLPPFPPPGAFEARFWLPPFTAGALISYQDYRNAPTFPFSGPKEQRVRWQYIDLATALTFTYSVQITITSNNATPVWTSGPRTGSGSYILDDPNNSHTAARIQVLYMSIIPIELVSFGAAVQGNSVNLSWQTATELNNSGFEIERKSQNTEWNRIGFVAGSGTTTESRSYSFVDNSLPVGSYSYRLKQIDYDGTFEYSNTVEVVTSIPVQYSLDQHYPNPFNPSTKIRFTIPEASIVSLKVFNAIGEEVATLVNEVYESGTNEIVFNASNLTSGIYFVRMEAGSFVSTRKITLLK